jgi:hypothetical protein
MYSLKPLTKKSIPAALKKAERYRLLKEPYEAESICLDILEADHGNQEALIMLLLARTDKFPDELYPAFDRAMEVLDLLTDEHNKFYYRGVIKERRAKTHQKKGGPSSAALAYDWYIKAMADYEEALKKGSPGNQAAALRWNTCARILNEKPHLKPDKQLDEVHVMDGYE